MRKESGMDELWTVEFCLTMQDIEDPTPSVDGELIVRGHDIFKVLDIAKARLGEFGFDHIVINCATRCGFEKKGE